MPRSTCLPILAACLLGGLSACGDRGAEGSERRPLTGGLKEREVPRVRTAPVIVQEMVRSISTTEPIESEREIELFPRVTGIVEEVLVEEGDRVVKGAPLCRLDQAQALAALADAQVALKEAQERQPKLEVGVRQAAESILRAKLTHEQAKAEYDRNNGAGLISRNDLEKLRLSMDQALRDWEADKLAAESAQADLNAVATTIERAQLVVQREELNLEWTTVTAPFDGVIARRTVELGDSVSSGSSLFVLTDTDRVRVIVHRPQRELAFFRRADARADTPIEIRAWPDALPDEAYAGNIRIVSPTIDATSGSFRLTIDLEQPAVDSDRPRLLPGMLVRLDIVVERHLEALVVPKRALRREGDRRFLFAVREGLARRVDVREGFPADELIEVLVDDPADLLPGEPVVVVGNRDLEDGDEVEPEDWRTEDDEDGAPAPDEATADASDEASGDEAAPAEDPEPVADESADAPEDDPASPDDEG